MIATVNRRRSWAAGSSDLDDLLPVYREHSRDLVRLASLVVSDRALAEEVVQDAFVKVHLAQRRGTAVLDPVAYVRRAVLNGARSALRQRAVRQRTVLPQPTDEEDRPAVSALAGEQREAVLAAVRRLPDLQRDCVLLRYFLDLSLAETAEALDVAVGTVKTSCHRALRSLAPVLEDLR